MFSTGHFFSGFVLAQILEFFFPITPWQQFWVVFASVFIPDLDYLWYSHEHRFSPTHTIYTPLVMAVLGMLVHPTLLYMSLATTLHLLLDSLDGGVMWTYPFSKKVYGLNVLKCSEPAPLFEYSRKYVRCKPIMALEITFFIAAVVLALI